MIFCLKTIKCLERLKKRISTSFWVPVHPKAGRNAQQTKFESFFLFCKHLRFCWTCMSNLCDVIHEFPLSYICKLFIFSEIYRIVSQKQLSDTPNSGDGPSGRTITIPPTQTDNGANKKPCCNWNRKSAVESADHFRSAIAYKRCLFFYTYTGTALMIVIRKKKICWG